MKNPPVTVLMSVYNGENYVRESIEGVLQQSFTDFEFLIIDDASTDSTPDILQSYKDDRIRIVRNARNLGLAKSLNSGLQLAKGRYIARMDADDICTANRLQKQYQFIQEHPQVAVVGGMAFLINETGETTGEFNYPVEFEKLFVELFFLNPLIHSTVFFDAETIRELGGYDESFDRAQDYELWVRVVAAKKQIHNINEKVIYYRNHAKGLTGGGFLRQEALAQQVICNAYNRLLKIKINPLRVEFLRKFLINGRQVLTRLEVLQILILFKQLQRALRKMPNAGSIQRYGEEKIAILTNSLVSNKRKRRVVKFFLLGFKI